MSLAAMAAEEVTIANLQVSLVWLDDHRPSMTTRLDMSALDFVLQL